MAITLNTILQFAGNDRVLLNAQGTGLQSVNRMQRFKSFFNIGNARQKNAETLTAIHFAVLNDPRFAAKDLQLEAVRLLEEVRVDRALSAAQIKSIAQALDRLGSGTDAIMDERVKKCMAHVDMPPEPEKYAKDVDWLLSEAFCQYKDREIFKPYEKNHSTVKEAGEVAERLGARNLILYHTEDKDMVHRKENYSAEAKEYFSGNVFVPEDLETLAL